MSEQQLLFEITVQELPVTEASRLFRQWSILLRLLHSAWSQPTCSSTYAEALPRL